MFPVHFWGLPAIVAEFFEALTLADAGRCFVYTVATYGTSTGQTGWMARKTLLDKGVAVDAGLSVRMVDTWTPLFNLTEKEIDAAIGRIVACRGGNAEGMRIPHLIAGVYHATYGSQRQTRHFHLMADRCAGCGLCADRCPSSAIEMRRQACVGQVAMHIVSALFAPLPGICHPVWQTHCAAWAICES